jgi:hypothetical protein
MSSNHDDDDGANLHLTYEQVCWLVNVGLMDLSTHNAIQCQCDMQQYTISCQIVGSKQPECSSQQEEENDDDEEYDDDDDDDDNDFQGDDDEDDSTTHDEDDDVVVSENIKAYPIHWNNLTCAANIHVTAYFRKNQESNLFFHQPVDRFSVCVNYDYEVLSKECVQRVRDTCAQFGYVNSLNSNKTDCTVQFSSTNTGIPDGKLQHCRTCHMCGSSGYSIDCSNIRAGAMTTGCHVWDAPDKDLFLFLSVHPDLGFKDNQTTTTTTASNENQPNSIVTATSTLTTTSRSVHSFPMSPVLMVLSTVASVATVIVS